MNFTNYFRVWAASLRYSLARAMMFRFDFLLWFLVDLAWIAVNLLLIQVVFGHIDALAGWTKHEMILLVGTSMTIGRLTMALFFTNMIEAGRNIRTGHFDFFLAQPGNPQFMISTRKLDPESAINALVGLGLVTYAAYQLGLSVQPLHLLLYGTLLVCGVVIHYSVLVLIVSTAFWIIKSEGVEGGYFTLFEFSRLPRSAFRGAAEVIFVYFFPAVIVSNIPAKTLMQGVTPLHIAWLGAAALAWFAISAFVFSLGVRRYASASS